MKPLLGVLSIAVLLLAEPQTPAAPDFNKARGEAVQILQDLIRIDTSNPPGNETKAAQYLQTILDKEGIPSEIVSLEPARGNLVARIKGRLDSALFRSIENTQATVFPGLVTLPIMFTAATDSAQLRAKGVQAYGLGSVLSEEDRTRMHGNDERLSIQGIGKFVELMYRAVAGVAAAK